jgi:hypothetical protein
LGGNATFYHATFGYEDVVAGSGVNRFPTTSQNSGSLYTLTASSGVNPWRVVCDVDTIWYFADYTGTNTNWQGMGFGKFVSYLAGDQYDYGIWAKTANNSSDNGNLDRYYWGTIPGASALQAGVYLARSHTGLGSAIQAAKITDLAKARSTSNPQGAGGTVQMGSGGMLLPNPADGKLYVSPIELVYTNSLRGRLRGLWSLSNNPASLALGSIIQGAPGSRHENRSFLIIKNTEATHCFCVEISDTWDDTP